MDYERKYKEALDWMQSLYDGLHGATKEEAEHYFPELKESEDERIRKGLIKAVSRIFEGHKLFDTDVTREEALAWLEKQGEPKDKGEISDGYHTFNELYRYRLLYNAAFFNLLPKELVHKSKKHHDGEECFGGGWFIVMANLPTGQISNHYELKDWDLFKIPEKEVADVWDGHTPQDAADRLHEYLLEKQGEQTHANLGQSEVTKTSDQELSDKIEPKFKAGDWIVINETTYQIIEIDNSHVVLSFNGRECNFGLDVFNNARLWTIADAKDGDVLTNGESIVIFKQIVEPKYRQYIKAYVGLDWGCIIQVTSEPWSLGIDKTMPATKEQRDLLFQKMKEAGYEWDADKKELKEIVPKKLIWWRG